MGDHLLIQIKIRLLGNSIGNTVHTISEIQFYIWVTQYPESSIHPFGEFFNANLHIILHMHQLISL